MRPVPRGDRELSFALGAIIAPDFPHTAPHSSRRRCLVESSQPSGMTVPGGLRRPRLNARRAHVHQGVSRKTAVSARSSRWSRVAWWFPPAIQSSPASKTRCVSRHSSSAGATQPGFQKCRSRWTRGRPVFAESAREKVLLPAPVNPVTTTRRPMASGPRGLIVAHVLGREAGRVSVLSRLTHCCTTSLRMAEF